MQRRKRGEPTLKKWRRAKFGDSCDGGAKMAMAAMAQQHRTRDLESC